MPDWKAAAQAFAPDIPEAQVERISVALDGLEAAFRPLMEQLPHDTEPAYVLLVDRESAE